MMLSRRISRSCGWHPLTCTRLMFGRVGWLSWPICSCPQPRPVFDWHCRCVVRVRVLKADISNRSAVATISVRNCSGRTVHDQQQHHQHKPFMFVPLYGFWFLHLFLGLPESLFPVDMYLLHVCAVLNSDCWSRFAPVVYLHLARRPTPVLRCKVMYPRRRFVACHLFWHVRWRHKSWRRCWRVMRGSLIGSACQAQPHVSANWHVCSQTEPPNC